MRHGGGELLSWEMAGVLSATVIGGPSIADPRSSQGHLNENIRWLLALPTHRTAILSDNFSSPLLRQLLKCKNRH